MRKKFLRMSAILFVIAILFLFVFSYYKRQIENKLRKEQLLIHDIKNHYHTSVITKKDCFLYRLESNHYQKIGKVSKEVELSLYHRNLDSSEEYFKIKDTDYYIYYEDVEKISSVKKLNSRFQNYLYFDESLKTKDTFSLYHEKEKIYTFYEAMDFPILMKTGQRYGVVYQNQFYYILKEDVSSVYEKQNNTQQKAEEIPVTVYHFLYLDEENCNEVICNSKSQVEEEFNYLKENHYFTLTTKEMEHFVKGEINLPKNSILITIDDGAKATNFLSILEKYQMNATLFLVSSWYPKEDFKSDYLELASHTHNLHTPGVCSGGQGSQLKCMEKDSLLNDLRQSRETLENTDAFCFPFYEYNSYAIEIVKEAGFQSAYIGSDRKAKIGDNPYLIPRITIHNHVLLDEYVQLIH